MPLLQQVLPGVFIAASVTAVLLALAAKSNLRKWLGAMALGLGYAGAHAASAGLPKFPPVEATDWLFYFSLAAAFAGMLDAAIRPARWLRWIISILACSLVISFLLPGHFGGDWSTRPLVLWLVWLARLVSGMVLFAWCLGKTSTTSLPTLLPLAMIITGGTAAALMLSASLLLGQLAMNLCAALFVGAVAAYCFPSFFLPRGMVPLIAVLLTSFWLSGCFFAELPAPSAGLLAAASLPGIIPFRKLSKLGAFLVQTALVLVLVGFALAVAYHASPPLDY